MQLADGRLIEAAPPEWFESHLARANDRSDWRGSIIEAGCSGLESFVTFRATYLAPLALLQMKADRFEEDRMKRKGPR